MNAPAATIRLNDSTVGDLRERLSAALVLSDAEVELDGCQRLPGDALGVLLALGSANRGRIHLRGAIPAVIRSLALADVNAVLAVDGGLTIAGERPFVISFPAPGIIALRLGREIGSHRLLADAIGHDWLRGIRADRLRLDLSELTHINSLLIAWLIQVGQSIAPGKAELINVHPQAATQFAQLRLTHLLPIVTG